MQDALTSANQLDLDLSPVWERLEEVNCLIRMFPEGISMEVMFELALG